MANSLPLPSWPDLPPPVRARISKELGARVLGWKNLPADVVPGAKLQVQTSLGSVVLTVVSISDADGLEVARREIAVVRALPKGAPAPELLWSFDEDFGDFGHWIVAGWGMRVVRPVGPEWTQEEVAATLGVLRQVNEIEAPPGAPYLEARELFAAGSWIRLANERPDGLRGFSPWLEPRLDALAQIAAHTAEAVSGSHLLHGAPDRRTLMIPLSPQEQGIAVGWFRAARGAPFVDVIQLLAQIRTDGGPAPEVVLAQHPLPPTVDPDAVTCLVTALTGQYIEQALGPVPAAGTTQRAPAQHALARVCVEWLRRRLGF
ncbi:hypothetical protein [Myceligenerans crystallogenes]|uniref:Aminoglycoside phosphotransferase domain-containing protein n=1 Tax=Myceligenerans crystallogenes TaxID=316335 RepID=A0ABN2N6G2_9MICO